MKDSRRYTDDQKEGCKGQLEGTDEPCRLALVHAETDGEGRYCREQCRVVDGVQEGCQTEYSEQEVSPDVGILLCADFDFDERPCRRRGHICCRGRYGF